MEIGYETNGMFVQGTLGKPTDRKWESAVVLQGPYVREHAEKVIRIYLERNNPAILVIVSTYLPVDIESPEALLEIDFLSPFEKEVLQDKTPYTGRLVYLFVRTPTPEEDAKFWETNMANQSRHRLSSFVGLSYADHLGIEFSLKCRLDCFLGMTDICSYLISQHQLFPLVVQLPKLRGRIVTGDLAKSQRESPWAFLDYFHIADFWFFGFTQDLLVYFDMREGTSWKKEPVIGNRISAENNFAMQWMQEVGISGAHLTHPDPLIELMARYFIVTDSVLTEFNFLKAWHRDHARYLREGKAYLSLIQQIERNYWPTITRERWLKLIEDYK